MPQESTEAWVGRMVEPLREWYSVLEQSFPRWSARATKVALLATLAFGGAGVYEGVLNGSASSIPTEESRIEHAQKAERVSFEFKMAGVAAATGAAAMIGGAFAQRRPNPGQ